VSDTATVSVVIPCYRQAHFLPQAVDSVLAQSHPSVQPIVVDDGSDDDTAAVARRYGDRIVYVHKSNGGLSSARNAGIRVAEGRYLHSLDADDSLHSDALAVLVEAMGANDNRLCLMGFRSFEGDVPPEQGTECQPPTPFSPLPDFLHRNPAPPNCYLCSRALVLRVGGFDEALRSCEDWDLWLRLAIHGVDGVSVPFVGAYYRRHAASMSRNRPLMLISRARVLVRAWHRIAAKPELYARWGPDLAEVAHRVRRRLLAGGAPAESIAEVSRCVHELRAAGFGIPASFQKRLLDALLGDRGEWLVMRYMQRFDPQAWSFYTEGVW
jgi:GT2 family glycosyltransferase